MVYSDRSELDLFDKTIKVKNFPFPKLKIYSQRHRSEMIIAQIEDLYEDRVKISRPYLIYRVLFNITILNFELLWL